MKTHTLIAVSLALCLSACDKAADRVPSLARTPTPVDEERVMQRTPIQGDYGLGRTLDFPVAAE